MNASDRKKKFNAIINSEEHDDLLGNVIWGRFDGIFGVDEAGDGECSFCDEGLKKKSVDISDVGESLQLCLPCGKLFAVHAKKVVQDWIDDELTEKEKEIDNALKGESS